MRNASAIRRIVLSLTGIVLVALIVYAAYWHYVAGMLRDQLLPWAQARATEGYDHPLGRRRGRRLPRLVSLRLHQSELRHAAAGAGGDGCRQRLGLGDAVESEALGIYDAERRTRRRAERHRRLRSAARRWRGRCRRPHRRRDRRDRHRSERPRPCPGHEDRRCRSAYRIARDAAAKPHRHRAGSVAAIERCYSARVRARLRQHAIGLFLRRRR